MKRMNIRDCMEIFQKTDYYFRNGLITASEVMEMTKEADKAYKEAKRELFEMMKTGKKWRIPFFEADLSDLMNRY